jgi:hypothetical protein
LAAVVPARIAVVSCDPSALAVARQVHAELDARLHALGGISSTCGSSYVRSLDCQTWEEPSCNQILVFVIGAAPLDPKHEVMAKSWWQASGGRAVIIPAIIPPLKHSEVFGGGAFPIMRKLTASPWLGSLKELVAAVMIAALLDERPGVFISYLRSEASSVAEQIHDALAKNGYRIFLDRFSGSPGRVFPHELAEAMSGMGLVCLLETAGLRNSRWTMFEARFASRYRVGPIALPFGTPGFRSAVARVDLSSFSPTAALPNVAVEEVVSFIAESYLRVTVARHAYYEALARLAARSRGGDVSLLFGGALRVLDSSQQAVGGVLPTGAPGKLRHVRRVVDYIPSGRIIAGEHQHLFVSDHADLKWLAGQHDIALAGSGSLYKAITRLL